MRFFVIKLLTIAGIFSLASCVHFKTNRFKNKQQHGYWITYYDKENGIKSTEGRFKNGIQKGKWLYYSKDGKKERKEIYRGDKISITHYHFNGKVAVLGKARIINDSAKIHFYYYGAWNFFTEEGKLQKISYYEKGTLIKEDVKLKSGNEVYDSLAAVLLQIDKNFVKYRDTLQKTAAKSGTASVNYQQLVQTSKQNEENIYRQIEYIIQQFGYPSKKYVGENNGVIFYLIGFAPLTYKEKFVEVFRQATVNGEIALSDFAYFEDKYLVAKYGYQLYGTQGKTTKDYKTVYYPVKKLSDMNDRRKKMNLEPVNLLEYKEVDE